MLGAALSISVTLIRLADAMLKKIEFASGLVRDDTPLAAEGGWIDADKVRFRQGKPQTIGGWTRGCATQFDAVARGAKSWVDLEGRKFLAFGTANKLYLFYDGQLRDITPSYRAEGVLIDPFSTEEDSDVIKVSHDSHGLNVGDAVIFSFADAVGGLTIDGSYTVVSLLDRNTYTITAASAASSTAVGGSSVDFTVAWANGNTNEITVWSLDNFGEILLACRRGGALYAFQPAAEYPEIVYNGQFTTASGDGWIFGRSANNSGGWSYNSDGKFAQCTPSSPVSSNNLSQNVEGLLKAGYMYRISFDLVRNAGTLKFRINAGDAPSVIDVGEASAVINTTGTYSRLFVAPADAKDIVFSADDDFNGQVDNVSIVLEDVAYHVNQAPQIIEGMFVDPNRFVVLFGTYEADGDYNSMLLRWSSQENFRLWIPDAENTAGELSVGRGSKIVGALASRQQNLIWTDEALYSMQFSGSTNGYSIRMLGAGCGLIGINAAVEQNGTSFWLSNDGNFYVFQGAVPQIIQCRIRKDVYDNISRANSDKIFAGVNSEFSEIWWFYPDTRDGTECSRYAAFNWIENHWTSGSMGRTAWVPLGVMSSPVAFGTDRYLYLHETGKTANGSAIQAFVESSYFDIEDGDTFLTIKSIVPDFDDQVGTTKFRVFTRMFPNGSELTAGPFDVQSTTQVIHFRRMARQAKIRISSESNPSFWRLGALRLDVDKTGVKR